MELVPMEEVFQGLDQRSVRPHDVLDALQGAVVAGKAREIVVICDDGEGNLLTAMTDMTNTQFIGLIEIARMNYIHNFQHK